MKKYIIIAIVFANFCGILTAQDCVQCDGGNASGSTSSIIGIDNIASGPASFAGGLDCQAIGKESFAFGDSARAMSMYSIALGKEVMAFGGTSIALGRYLRTTISSSYWLWI